MSDVSRSKNEENEAYLSEIEVGFLFFEGTEFFPHDNFFLLFSLWNLSIFYNVNFCLSLDFFLTDYWTSIWWHADPKPTSVASDYWERWLQY